MSERAIEIRAADLGDPAQAAALVEILDAYAREPNGQSAPIPAEARASLAAGLQANPTAFVLLAFDGARAVGAAVCFVGFSTFAGKPLVNLHDLAVLPSHRGRGIGSLLLAEVERCARERGACKVTLEVHDTNHGAKRLYESIGFGPWGSPTLFVSKRL
jgi:ribosomal protein S18 acetylase RimI-like enzyme